MTARMQNFDMVSGDTKIIEVTVWDADEGKKLDLTGANIEWTIFRKPHKIEVTTKTVGSGITVTSPTEGVLRIRMDPEDTKNLEGLFDHRLRIEKDGQVTTVTEGELRIRK